MPKAPWQGQYRRCETCGHANRLAGCTCENPACICYKKNKNKWNGVPSAQGMGYVPEGDKRVRHRGNG